jgi:hypothetical protein
MKEEEKYFARLKEKEEKLKSILDEIERHRKAAKDKKLKFTAPTKKQIWKKLTKEGSPMIVFQSWSDTTLGGTFNYNVGIKNPDPTRRIWMFNHVFIGPANMDSDVGQALCTVDTRFPRLTLPDFAGLAIDSGATESLTYSIKVPNNVERTNYLGNSFLFRANWHDVGEYLDRSIFVFEVK